MGDSPQGFGDGALALGVLDNLLEGCQVIGPDYRYVYVNDALVRHSRSSRESLLGRTMSDCYPGIEQTPMFATLERCMRERVSALLENEFTFPDGSHGWFELRFEPVPSGIAILSVEITDKKRFELALQRTIRALQTLSQVNRTLVRATEAADLVRTICDTITEVGGYVAASIVVDAEDGELSAGSEGNGHVSTFAIPVEGQQAGTLTVWSHHALGDDEGRLLEEIAMDAGFGIETLRARRRHAATQQQLIAAQRLEAVGQLVGGIAHDFNNLLAVVLMYSGFVLEQLDEGEPMWNDLDQVRRAGESASVLVRRLLAFSRKQVMEPKVICVNEVVEGVGAMVGRLLDPRIEVVIDLAEDLPSTVLDPGQLEQVLMNLIVNARDAMPDGGRLTIETAEVMLQDDYAKRHLFDLKAGRHVRISVSDTGAGMTEETRNRIFEPFFTTKDVKGTGLGLAVVYGIVKQCEGNIWVYSEPGHGTVFKIYFPCVDAAHSVEPASAHEGAVAGELILVVDDDDRIRAATERILQSAGYRVIAVASGEEALDACRESSVDLLLADVMMPSMSGSEIADRMRALLPSSKVVFTSGYSDQTIVQQRTLERGMRFLSKPFSSSELVRAVRATLDGR